MKPFLPEMTVSELFAVMVGGYSTVSGSVLAAYIGFGVIVSFKSLHIKLNELFFTGPSRSFTGTNS